MEKLDTAQDDARTGQGQTKDKASTDTRADLTEEVTLTNDCFGENVAKEFLRLRVEGGLRYQEALDLALARKKPDLDNYNSRIRGKRLGRGWNLRLGSWAKKEYRKSFSSWCKEHRQYLSDCQHFREWLVEQDNENRGI